MITHKHVQKMLLVTARRLENQASMIDAGTDLAEVMDAVFPLLARCQNVINAFDTQELMARAPSELGYGSKHDGN